MHPGQLIQYPQVNIVIWKNNNTHRGNEICDRTNNNILRQELGSVRLVLIISGRWEVGLKNGWKVSLTNR